MFKRLGYSLTVLLTGLAVAYVWFGDFSNDDPELEIRPPVFIGDFIALSDIDQSASTYATGHLDRLEAGRDELARFRNGIRHDVIEASNSVMGWPEVAAVSADGRFAFIVETRGPPPDTHDRVENIRAALAPGRTLKIFALEKYNLSLVDEIKTIGINPQSVAYVEAGHFLVIATERMDGELVIVPLLQDGRAGPIRRLRIDFQRETADREPYLRSLHPSPDGRLLAANVANRRVQFFALTYDASDLPVAVEPFGASTERIGRRIAAGKWTSDSRHFLISDTNGGGSSLYMLQLHPGSMISLRPPADPKGMPQIVSKATVGRFPESFDISPDESRIASINMERTYLPNYAYLSHWPHRRRYSISLLSFDAETGELALLDTAYQAGVLPEDIIFDETGRNLAVAVFHRRLGPDSRRGFIDFFSLDATYTQISSQTITQPLMRGAHVLERIPAAE